MSYTSKQKSRREPGRIAGLALLFTCSLALGQPPAEPDSETLNPDSALARVRQLLGTIDAQAAACNETYEQTAGEVLAVECVDFLSAIDGEPVVDYLVQCRRLRQWRDEFIEDNLQAEASNSDSDNLQRLMNIEFYCGEGALIIRTEYVASTFATLNQSATARQQSSLAAGIYEYQQLRSLNSPAGGTSQRLRDETGRLWQQLELEILRQQQNRTLD